MFSCKSLMKMPSSGRWLSANTTLLGDVRSFIHTIWVIQPPNAIHPHLHAVRAPPHLQVLFTRHHEGPARPAKFPATGVGTLLCSPTPRMLFKKKMSLIFLIEFPAFNGPSSLSSQKSLSYFIMISFLGNYVKALNTWARTGVIFSTLLR